MDLFLVIWMAVLFPLLHILNGWVFQFAEISPHIALVYLPAFLRLANVLILGRVHGTAATLLGGMLLMRYFDENSWVGLLNTICSAAGPLLALSLFRWHAARPVNLTSLKDLTWLTLVYAAANAMLHHAMWSLLDPSVLVAPVQIFQMILGDIAGALLGAYCMKWCIVGYRRRKLGADLN